MEIDGWTPADYDRWKRRLDFVVLTTAVLLLSTLATYYVLGQPNDWLITFVLPVCWVVFFVALLRLVFGFLIKRPVSEDELFLKTLNELRVERT